MLSASLIPRLGIVFAAEIPNRKKTLRESLKMKRGMVEAVQLDVASMN
jgi:hypothetical protein